MRLALALIALLVCTATYGQKSTTHPSVEAERLFAGYHQWTERLDAYGATFTVNAFGDPDIGLRPGLTVSISRRW